MISSVVMLYAKWLSVPLIISKFVQLAQSLTVVRSSNEASNDLIGLN